MGRLWEIPGLAAGKKLRTNYPRIVALTMTDRPSGYETAPLLRDPDADSEDGETTTSNPTWSERLNSESLAQKPLTPLTKLLLCISLVLLILAAVFIGLFAGVQHKLNSERGRNGDDDKPPSTVTFTATSTVLATTTAHLPSPTNAPKEPVCLTPQCVMLSSSILSSLDTSEDPCENFYEYANGGWLRAHPLPSDKSSFGKFEALAQQNEQIIQRILETPSPSSFKTSYDEQILGKLRGFYNSCLNETRLDERGQEPLAEFVQTLRKLYRGERLSVSSTPEEQKEEGRRLTEALAFLHSRGIDALFDFRIEGDVGVDPNHMILWFSQPGLGLPSKKYYQEEEIRDMYQDVLTRLILSVAEAEEKMLRQKEGMSTLSFTAQSENIWSPWPWPPLGGDGDDVDDDKLENQTAKAYKLAGKVLQFETKLADASLDPEILRDPVATYNPAPLSNLTIALPQIHFKEYFASFTPRSFPDRVIMTYPPYAISLSDILDRTSSEVIETYLVVRTALTLSPYLGMSAPSWRAQRTLYEVLSGIKKGAVGDRAEYCVQQVEEKLGFAAGRYFVNETFTGESREKGTKVITDIVKSFQRSLQDIDWMDEKSAKAASQKAEAIRVKVGFPLSPDTRDPASIANYYRLVQGDEDKFFENVLSAGSSDKFKAWLQLGKQRDPDSWRMYPSIVDAYFKAPANMIVFPAGILQPPFFNKDWPSYMLYGAFGSVASHELTHAFDSAGRLYNQDGKLEQWWTNETSDGFNEKLDCIVKQFSEYTIDDGKGGKVHVNGNLTSGENIGDSGLIQAYRAWKAQYNESYLAGNEEQLFFISFGRIWATNMKPVAAVQRIRTDPHSPDKYRVDGTVFNIPEFAEAFNCSKKAKLNPPREKQCIFWGNV
ncbi:hypothetical protein D9758_006925 [Tetrapyrgos nigripes]|uniref:Endothelin-converting enzyme 1 n=1 Tax=Tetrapyrgos nigripes TaxID=182062 RepID=A0A8H5GSH1_9AGAR|nr:hypothetical protein D9758_006925 [Tetrapyrgos nigripes]